jgi:hypothetical protein
MSSNIRAALERLIEIEDATSTNGADPDMTAWNAAIAAARAALAAEPVGEGPSDEDSEHLQWYTYDPEDPFGEDIKLHPSKDEAQSAARLIISASEYEAPDYGWPENIHRVSWGVLTPVENAQIVERGTTFPDGVGKEWVRYELRPARWGRPDTLPAPEPGEVGEAVTWLERYRDLMHPVHDSDDIAQFTRIATLLEQLSAPAPVPLPQAEEGK